MIEWAEHPFLKPPSDDEIALMEPEDFVKVHRTYHEAITNAAKDPYRFGCRLPHWKRVEECFAEDDEELILGGNRSSKTEFAAQTVVRAGMENPDGEIFCFAQNAKVSIRQQQRAVWKWLPVELKRKTTGQITNISYTKKNGFTDSSLILPNGTQIIFMTYSQFQQDDTILEGAELGSHDPEYANIGAWLDEYLGGPALIDTIRFRLATRNAKLLVTFTPIRGWTQVIHSYLDGAKTIEAARADLLGGELVPVLQKCRTRKAHVHYFHSISNPFNNYERLARDLKGETREKILIRAYGVPTKSFTAAFPKFSRDVNVVPSDQVPSTGITRYQIIDPAGRKNWFMTWIAVNSEGEWWIYREWPNISMGPWAEPADDGEWKPGDGSHGLGYGYQDYLDLIEDLETGEDGRREEIATRLIDPRLGAQRYQKANGDSCIIEDLNELDFIVIPAPGGEIEDGLQDLQNLLAYDTSRVMDGTNRPKLHISEECENTIMGFENYTGEGGKNEAWKDPIDCPRYAAAYGIDHIPEGSLAVTCRGAGGY